MTVSLQSFPYFIVSFFVEMRAYLESSRLTGKARWVLGWRTRQEKPPGTSCAHDTFPASSGPKQMEREVKWPLCGEQLLSRLIHGTGERREKEKTFIWHSVQTELQLSTWLPLYPKENTSEPLVQTITFKLFYLWLFCIINYYSFSVWNGTNKK